MFKKTLIALLLSCSASAFALPFSSQHALVFDEETGKILFEKNADAIVPIASITKLMTAMVVLDAKQDMNEMISIDESDVDTLKHSSSRVPVGVSLPRKDILQLALMSSDNRAAASLARTYPGGKPAFVAAVREKLIALDMRQTKIEEPTGLSPHNMSTAADLVKMVTAAGHYPEITQLTTETGEQFDINGHPVRYRNTNSLVGKKGWDILLSKTGFTREAGRCLVMRLQSAGKNVTVVLLNARESAQRLGDAQNVQRFLNGEPMFAARPVRVATRKARPGRSAMVLVKAKAATVKIRKKRPTT
jgi:D-alanyl-D-alanine carboxypeptidase/D-alanyl-D-alanine endopeptidase (penicillin-binding protein 7)